MLLKQFIQRCVVAWTARDAAAVVVVVATLVAGGAVYLAVDTVWSTAAMAAIFTLGCLAMAVLMAGDTTTRGALVAGAMILVATMFLPLFLSGRAYWQEHLLGLGISAVTYTFILGATRSQSAGYLLTGALALAVAMLLPPYLFL
ncbi:MAG: hypothetical protein L0332_33170 [Chloroflexi bacterium]|nr:hypothetical protein [Chloroflexota bacterium]MCI0577381.1 hypothetical protein [Chloroflexota bacterium]MCI0647068.1 hypothetical protein [Chloroflexota bacterium]MCI0731555.1 hypothetical protein [Chloroflexota bacterium]